MQAKRSLIEDYPVICPFCDELAYLDPTEKAKVWPHKIIRKRKCIMGHELYSVEEIPENQAEIADMIKEFGKDMREWKAYVRRERAENFKNQRRRFVGELPMEESSSS